MRSVSAPREIPPGGSIARTTLPVWRGGGPKVEDTTTSICPVRSVNCFPLPSMGKGWAGHTKRENNFL